MEWFNEILGLLIVLFVFLFPLFRKLLLKKRGQPEKEEIEVVEEEEEYEIKPLPPAAPPPPSKRPTTERLVKKDFEFHADIEDRELTSQIETRKFETRIAPSFKDRIVSESFILTPMKKKKRQRFIKNLTERRDPLQAMVMLSEIFKPPKSLE